VEIEDGKNHTPTELVVPPPPILGGPMHCVEGDVEGDGYRRDSRLAIQKEDSVYVHIYNQYSSKTPQHEKKNINNCKPKNKTSTNAVNPTVESCMQSPDAGPCLDGAQQQLQDGNDSAEEAQTHDSPESVPL
jgi:hypothetical protein